MTGRRIRCPFKYANSIQTLVLHPARIPGAGRGIAFIADSNLPARCRRFTVILLRLSETALPGYGCSHSVASPQVSRSSKIDASSFRHLHFVFGNALPDDTRRRPFVSHSFTPARKRDSVRVTEVDSSENPDENADPASVRPGGRSPGNSFF